MTLSSSNSALVRSKTRQRNPIHGLGFRVQNSHTFVLAGAALLSGLIYWLVFSRQYNLLNLYDRPLLDLWKLSKDDPLARWRLLGGMLAQGALYWLGWRVARHARSRAAWAVVLAGALLSSVILLFLYPFDAADVFDNIMHGRILGVYGANPFQQAARDYKMDPFFLYTAWRYTSSAYGPAWEILAGGAARLAGNDVVTNVITFKLLGGLFLFGSVGVVAAILKRAAPGRALAGVVLVAWNPVILYETLGHGHNDMVMVFWILFAAWTLLHRRYTLTILALVIGGLVKFIPLLMVPAALLIALRRLPHVRARLRFLIVTSLTSTLLIIVAYAPFWHGTETLNIKMRQEMFTTSLPSVVYVLLEPRLGDEHAAAIISRIAVGLTFIFAFGQAVWAGRRGTWLAFSRAAFYTLMFYLLLTCLWFQPWYAVWPLGLAALLPPGHAARLGALFGYAALAKPLLVGPLWLWFRPLPPKIWRELRLGPAVLAVPWLYSLFAIWHSRHRQKTQTQTQTQNQNQNHTTGHT